MTTTNEGGRRPEDKAMDKIRDERASKGIGPGETALGEYLTERLMREPEIAERLLVNTALNVSEIAERCGYPDASHFMKLFRKKKGMTASEYRNAAKQKAGSQ